MAIILAESARVFFVFVFFFKFEIGIAFPRSVIGYFLKG